MREHLGQEEINGFKLLGEEFFETMTEDTSNPNYRNEFFNHIDGCQECSKRISDSELNTYKKIKTEQEINEEVSYLGRLAKTDLNKFMETIVMMPNDELNDLIEEISPREDEKKQYEEMVERTLDGTMTIEELSTMMANKEKSLSYIKCSVHEMAKKIRDEKKHMGV